MSSDIPVTSKEWRCNCPSGSYSIKHSNACYEGQIKYLERQLDQMTSLAGNVLPQLHDAVTRLGHEPCERHEQALHRINQWAEAYPLEVFPAPDWKRSREVLEAAGLSLDRISAANMRHVITKVKEIADTPDCSSPPPVPEWQPMETAPKDGRKFLAIGMGPMFMCRWGSGANIWMDDSGQVRDPRLWQHLPEGPTLTKGGDHG